MKIYRRVNFKNKAELKAFVLGMLIMIIVMQIVALGIWFLFDKNHFIGLLFASIAGFLFGYKGLKKKS